MNKMPQENLQKLKYSCFHGALAIQFYLQAHEKQAVTNFTSLEKGRQCDLDYSNRQSSGTSSECVCPPASVLQGECVGVF